jgi:hypothetical protein
MLRHVVFRTNAFHNDPSMTAYVMCFLTQLWILVSQNLEQVTSHLLHTDLCNLCLNLRCSVVYHEIRPHRKNLTYRNFTGKS